MRTTNCVKSNLFLMGGKGNCGGQSTCDLIIHYILIKLEFGNGGFEGKGKPEPTVENEPQRNVASGHIRAWRVFSLRFIPNLSLKNSNIEVKYPIFERLFFKQVEERCKVFERWITRSFKGKTLQKCSP